jgi:hypothetical protein
MNDSTLTITHDPPECETFKGIIARNRVGYEGVPPAPIPPTEDAEVALLVARTPADELRATAEAFGFSGLDGTDPATAARSVLREMRRRGWAVVFPELETKGTS